MHSKLTYTASPTVRIFKCLTLNLSSYNIIFFVIYNMFWSTVTTTFVFCIIINVSRWKQLLKSSSFEKKIEKIVHVKFQNAREKRNDERHSTQKVCIYTWNRKIIFFFSFFLCNKGNMRIDNRIYKEVKTSLRQPTRVSKEEET